MKILLDVKWLYIEPHEEPFRCQMVHNPLKNHLGVKWFYIEPPGEPFWCQMVLYRTPWRTL